MKGSRAALFAVLLLPLTGCVFAVGVDDDKNEALRDRVRDLERRMDRMDRPRPMGPPATIVPRSDVIEAPREPSVPVPPKEPK